MVDKPSGADGSSIAPQNQDYISPEPKPDLESAELEKFASLTVDDGSQIASIRNRPAEEAEKEAYLELTRTSTCIPPPVTVPRSQRRGLFGRFTVLAEVENPKHYSRSTKWFITFVVAVAGAAAPLGSAIFFR